MVVTSLLRPLRGKSSSLSLIATQVGKERPLNIRAALFETEHNALYVYFQAAIAENSERSKEIAFVMEKIRESSVR